MPRPPPPATALMTMPPAPCAICSAKKASASDSVVAWFRPGISGTPHSAASARARALSPNSASCSGVGPMKVRPASVQAWANAALSLRKP